MASNIFSSLFGPASKAPTHTPSFPYDIQSNPYRCKRPWPPDFSQLSQRHQFLLERRFRRRSKLKWARPTWVKSVKLVQWGAILFVCVYGVFYLDVHEATGRGERKHEERKTVFDGARKWYAKQMEGFRGQRERGTGGMERRDEG